MVPWHIRAAQWFPIDLQVVNPGKGYLDVEATK
jgi:hypothetical protein